jgi:hypothetical protein
MDVWLPSGDWFEIHTGTMQTGPRTRSIQVHLLDVPVYAKAGAVVPRLPPREGGSSSVGRASEPYRALEWTIYPGKASGAGVVYEDDGETYDYLKGKSAVTTLKYARSSDQSQLNVSLALTGSGFATLPSSRAHIVRLPSTLPPMKVVVNGTQELKWARRGHIGSGTWSYDGEDLAVAVHLSPSATLAPLSITLTWPKASALLETQSTAGVRGMVAAARRAKANLNLRRMAPGEHSSKPYQGGSPLAIVSSMVENLAAEAGSDAQAFAKTLANVSAAFNAATLEVKTLAADPSLQPEEKLRVGYSLKILNAAAAGA